MEKTSLIEMCLKRIFSSVFFWLEKEKNVREISVVSTCFHHVLCSSGIKHANSIMQNWEGDSEIERDGRESER